MVSRAGTTTAREPAGDASPAAASLGSCVAAAAALGDATRLRLLLALRSGELCACQLVELAGLANSTVSRHMSVLAAAGLVEQRREGRWAYFSLPASPGPEAAGLIAWAIAAAGGSAQAASDAAVLREITRLSPAELCRQQRAGNGCVCGPRAPRERRAVTTSTTRQATRRATPRKRPT